MLIMLAPVVSVAPGPGRRHRTTPSLPREPLSGPQQPPLVLTTLDTKFRHRTKAQAISHAVGPLPIYEPPQRPGPQVGEGWIGSGRKNPKEL